MTNPETGTVGGVGYSGAPGTLRAVKIICSREIGAIFDSSIAYIYFIAFTLLSVGVFMNDFFVVSVIDMTPYFNMLPLLLIVLIPALTMRIWAEEKRVETFELLMTMPLTPAQIVAGKFLAVFVFYLLTLCGSLPVVVMLESLGSPDLGLIFAGYAGSALLGALFISFGLFTSGLTANQIVAFVLAVFTGFLFVFSGDDRVVSILDGLTPRVQAGTLLYESFSAVPHFEAMTGGLISAAGVFYFAAMTVLFLWMNAISVNRSRI